MSSRKKVLIIDDDADMRRGLAARLKTNNYETAFAVDAISAVSATIREKPDVILLDLGLPGGDGFVVMDRLKNLASAAGVPVIVVSARNPSAFEKRAIDAGAHAYFQKPVDLEALLSAIGTALVSS